MDMINNTIQANLCLKCKLYIFNRQENKKFMSFYLGMRKERIKFT